MSFVRTVLGDIDPADLGPTYSHEHLVIDGGFLIQLYPDFQLGDVDKAVAELEPAAELGLRGIIDAMPCDIGRNVVKLAEISRRTGVHIVAPTGLHLAKYYPERHWGADATVDDLVRLFVADIVEGVDENDYNGPFVRRTEHRAGLIKAAGSRDRLSDHDQRVFEAAAIAHRQTGAPILTHCQDGTAGLEQVVVLTGHGVPARKIALSHVDKVVDRGYHRELLATGAFVEYDQAFRWPAGEPNGTLQLIEWMVEDGYARQILLGLDAARRGYWVTYGGRPGWTFLLGPFSVLMGQNGVSEADRRRFFVENPAAVFSFVDRG